MSKEDDRLPAEGALDLRGRAIVVVMEEEAEDGDDTAAPPAEHQPETAQHGAELRIEDAEPATMQEALDAYYADAHPSDSSDLRALDASDTGVVQFDNSGMYEDNNACDEASSPNRDTPHSTAREDDDRNLAGNSDSYDTAEQPTYDDQYGDQYEYSEPYEYAAEPASEASNADTSSRDGDEYGNDNQYSDQYEYSESYEYADEPAFKAPRTEASSSDELQYGAADPYAAESGDEDQDEYGGAYDGQDADPYAYGDQDEYSYEDEGTYWYDDTTPDDAASDTGDCVSREESDEGLGDDAASGGVAEAGADAGWQVDGIDLHRLARTLWQATGLATNLQWADTVRTHVENVWVQADELLRRSELMEAYQGWYTWTEVLDHLANAQRKPMSADANATLAGPTSEPAQNGDLSELPPPPAVESDAHLDAAPWDVEDTVVVTPSEPVKPSTASDLQRDALVWAARALDRIGTACHRASRSLERVATRTGPATTLARQPDTLSH